jgi:hypothetical protein
MVLERDAAALGRRLPLGGGSDCPVRTDAERTAREDDCDRYQDRARAGTTHHVPAIADPHKKGCVG